MEAVCQHNGLSAIVCVSIQHEVRCNSHRQSRAAMCRRKADGSSGGSSSGARCMIDNSTLHALFCVLWIHLTDRRLATHSIEQTA